jgi:hypothetical protein
MKAGIFDGELRNYFFQVMNAKDGGNAVLSRASGTSQTAFAST